MRWRWLGSVSLGAAISLALIPGTAAVAAQVPSSGEAAATSPAPSQPAGPPPSVAALEAEMLSRINQERAAAGVGPVEPVAWAHSVAVQHSQEMAAAQDIWHNISGYINQGRKAMGATALGENVAMDSTLAAADALLYSDIPHRDVTLDPRYNYVGIGIALDNRNWVYVTEDFARLPGGPPAAPAVAVVAPTRPAAQTAAPKTTPAKPPVVAKPAVAAAPALPAAPVVPAQPITAPAAPPAPAPPAPAAAAPATGGTAVAPQPIVAAPVSHTTPLTGILLGTGILGLLITALAVRRMMSLLVSPSQLPGWKPGELG